MIDPQELLKLEPGWDGYDGKKINPQTVEMATKLGEAVAPFIPEYPPQYVPTADGDVQIEWHAGGWDIELWVSRPR